MESDGLEDTQQEPEEVKAVEQSFRETGVYKEIAKKRDEYQAR